MSKPSQDWINECMRWGGVVLTGKRAHWCPEWDYLPIDETCPEIEACSCDFTDDDPGPALATGRPAP